MKWLEYKEKFNEVLEGVNKDYPYDNPDYVNFVKLNSSRLNRWMKKAELSKETKDVIDRVECHQQWILITEPWCGDAANIAPIIELFTEYSDKIDFQIELRDDSTLIDSYLTNGGKAIPILIARNNDGTDVFVWGPRPAECQAMVMKNKNSDMSSSDKKIAIQQWYNQDKGVSTQKEIRELLEASCNVLK